MIFQTETLNPQLPNAARMSAPPPGGSPPPQSPPQYPPYPQQPPQGYPPQYPPQQPYYAPPTPPPKASHTALIIVVVVVVVVVVLAALVWYAVTMMFAPVQSTTQITVSGAAFAINYPGSNPFFGTSPITACANCPIKVTMFSQFSYTLSLHNSDTVSHSVTQVVLTGTNFNLVTSTPDPSPGNPLVVPGGTTGTIVLTIQPSTIGGTYTLTGTVDVT